MTGCFLPDYGLDLLCKGIRPETRLVFFDLPVDHLTHPARRTVRLTVEATSGVVQQGLYERFVPLIVQRVTTRRRPESSLGIFIAGGSGAILRVITQPAVALASLLVTCGPSVTKFLPRAYLLPEATRRDCRPAGAAGRAGADGVAAGPAV